MDEKEYYLQSKFYYPKDLETSKNRHQRRPRSHWRFRKQTEKWKRKKKTSTNMITLLRFIEANGLNSQTIESLTASELGHLSPISFMNVRRKRWIRASNIFPFSAQYTAILIREEISIQHTQGQWVWKIEKSSSCKSQVTSLQLNTTEETSCKLTKTKKMLFLNQENSATPIQLHSKELCGGFYPYTWVSKPEMRAMRTIDLMLLLLRLNVIFTATFSWSVLCDGLVKFRRNQFCEFQKQTAAVKIFVKFRYKSFLMSFL